MERVELKEIAQNWIDGLIKDKEFIAAVDRYSSALIAAKPIVRRSKLPKQKPENEKSWFQQWDEAIKKM
jgi:hypothetical protein